MARKAYGLHATQVNLSSYPDDGTSPVGSAEWNEALDNEGMLGFTPQTANSSTIIIASGVATITDSVSVIAGEGATTDTLQKLALTNTNEYDLVYLFAASGSYNITLEHGDLNADGEVSTVSGANETLSTTKPTILMRKGNYWYGYGGGSASNLEVSNLAAATLVTESEGIGSNDNDTTLPTSAAVKDYVDTQVATEDTITELNDTTISGIASGELLKWNGSAWINQTLGEAGIAASGAKLSDFAATTSAELAGTISDETGSGALAFATSPTLVTPVLGTPASGDLQNCTALPAAQVTQGTMASGMVLVAPALGTPASGVATNLTGTAASLTAGTATVATTVTITDNESTNESNALIFTAGGDIDGGNLGLESDGTCTYNPSTGKITATGFVGTLTGAVTGAVDADGGDVDNIQNLVHDLTSTVSVSGARTLDFNADQLETWALSGSTAITFNTSSNKAEGRSKTIRLVNDGTAQNLTLHSDWKKVGAAPSDIAASKTGILTITCFGSAETDIVAAYAVEA